MIVRRAIAFSILTASAAIAGCSSSPLQSLGSIGSIGNSKSVSQTERVFLMAAGSWDRNRDNIVTCEEWKAYTVELFNNADTNRDDILDASEWPRVVSTDRMFETADLAYFDQNGDGKLTRDEFSGKPNPAFVLMDTAKTCQLNGAQIAGARSKTEYDVSGKKAEDPREAEDKQVDRAGGGR